MLGSMNKECIYAWFYDKECEQSNGHEEEMKRENNRNKCIIFL